VLMAYRVIFVRRLHFVSCLDTRYCRVGRGAAEVQKDCGQEELKALMVPAMRPRDFTSSLVLAAVV
jgi:hypothetical protein